MFSLFIINDIDIDKHHHFRFLNGEEERDFCLDYTSEVQMSQQFQLPLDHKRSRACG